MQAVCIFLRKRLVLCLANGIGAITLRKTNFNKTTLSISVKCPVKSYKEMSEGNKGVIRGTAPLMMF
jgi:hypothetical protein